MTVLPESSNFNTMRMEVEGRSYERGAEPQPDQYEVTPDYFRTLSIPLRSGRLFSEEDDRRHEQVALVNRTAAERIWPGLDPLGRRIHTGGKDEPWRRVVGVVGDVYQYGLDSQKTLQVYVPYRQNRMSSLTLLVGARDNAMALLPAIRETLRHIDPELPLAEVTTMERVLADSMAGRRFPMLLLAALGLCAVVLAAIGIYGVTAYSVAQRTAEFGVRMALGAQPRDIIGLLLRGNAVLFAAGAALGIAIGLAATRLLAGLLFGVTAADPATFAGAATLLGLVTMAACYLPARRATRGDPMRALRGE